MTTKFYFFIALISIALIAKSQGRFIRFGAGYSRTNVTQDFLKLSDLPDQYKGGFNFQITFNKMTSDSYYWGSGIGYYQKGYKFDVNFFDEFGNPMGQETLVWRFHYLGVPMFLGYQTTGDLKFFAELGAIPGILINSNLKQPDFTGQGIQTNVTEFITRFDLSLNSVLGLRKVLDDTYLIEFSTSFQHSLLGVEFENINVGDNIYNHLGIVIMMGLVRNF